VKKLPEIVFRAMGNYH